MILIRTELKGREGKGREAKGRKAKGREGKPSGLAFFYVCVMRYREE